MIQSEAVSNGNRGLLIVFEGINKMEIITQSKELLDFFNAHVSNSAESISFPSKQT